MCISFIPPYISSVKVSPFGTARLVFTEKYKQGIRNIATLTD
ncbi:hypothetical protein AB4Z45_20830 [Paenibacillus sp. MCAF9]